MNRIDDSGTRVSLLNRLGSDQSDPGAWAEFIEHYGRKIRAWCRNWGLQEADAQDVTQHVLLNLHLRFRNFRYEPGLSFRAWLKTLTHHAWQDLLRSRKRHVQGSGDSAIHGLATNVVAREDLVQRLQEAFDQELLDEAMARVRLRVESRTWQAFQLLTIEEWSGATTARHLNMKVATVYVARSKVLRMIREEVGRLELG